MWDLEDSLSLWPACCSDISYWISRKCEADHADLALHELNCSVSIAWKYFSPRDSSGMSVHHYQPLKAGAGVAQLIVCSIIWFLQAGGVQLCRGKNSLVQMSPVIISQCTLVEVFHRRHWENVAEGEKLLKLKEIGSFEEQGKMIRFGFRRHLLKWKDFSVRRVHAKIWKLYSIRFST